MFKLHHHLAAITSVAVMALLLGVYTPVLAYRIEETGIKDVINDFVVGPGKIEIELKPGETKTVELHITNRMADEKSFTLNTEDFAGSQDPNHTVVLLGNERGPYTLKDYLKPDVTTVLLRHGQRAVIPVTIYVPPDAEPGGRYGSVLISVASNPKEQPEGEISGGAAIISRIGVLFFVRVAGDAKESGMLKEFSIKGSQFIFDGQPVTFRLLYSNDGSVHLDPYGTIVITNISGSSIDKLTVDPWFAMPSSLRSREISWGEGRPLMVGRYKAKAEINRGYGGIIDTKEITFWYLPWKLMTGAFVGLTLLIIAIRYIATHFKVARK